VNARSGEPSDTLSGVFCDETERQIGEIWLPVDKQIPEQARELISEAEVLKNIMLKDTVDDEFTTGQDVAQATLLFAAVESNALRPVAGREARLVHAMTPCPFGGELNG
jgi:hypothetical protein